MHNVINAVRDCIGKKTMLVFLPTAVLIGSFLYQKRKKWGRLRSEKLQKIEENLGFSLHILLFLSLLLFFRHPTTTIIGFVIWFIGYFLVKPAFQRIFYHVEHFCVGEYIKMRREQAQIERTRKKYWAKTAKSSTIEPHNDLAFFPKNKSSPKEFRTTSFDPVNGKVLIDTIYDSITKTRKLILTGKNKTLKVTINMPPQLLRERQHEISRKIYHAFLTMSSVEGEITINA